ncbi:MAG: DUF111 family protein [Helicobacteraceae bacterium]|nr:DUF111 family protein [Helicobacteraceae bacterium]
MGNWRHRSAGGLILYYDCFGGIGGDTHLGALVDVGAEFDLIARDLSALPNSGEFALSCEKRVKNGISGTRVEVRESADRRKRSFEEIKGLIAAAALKESVKSMSVKIFTTLAEADAKSGGLSAPRFLGAADCIAEVVGAAIAIEALGPSAICCGKVELGGGHVGRGVVPSPVTIELLKNAPVSVGHSDGELTTPIGAAILAAVIDRFADRFSFKPIKIGYGLGGKDRELPLRVIAAEEDDREESDEVLIETNIDDMSPEALAFAEERLFDHGALDVHKTAISMKKNRLGVKLSVLIPRSKEREIADLIFTETTSTGYKRIALTKVALKREFVTAATEYGAVRVKRAVKDGAPIKYKAEFEECRALALKHKLPLSEIAAAVERALRSLS